jgi:hypothetical protein
MGMNISAWLRNEHMGAGKVDLPKVRLDAIYFHPVGHALRHPRAEDPIDEELVADIEANGILEPVTVRVEHNPKGKKVLALCDGARRTIHGLVAQERLRKRKDTLVLKPLDDGEPKGDLPVPIKMLPGDTTDLQFLVERQAKDKQPWKKLHGVRVLALWVIQMNKHDANRKLIMNGLPKGWTWPTVEQVLLHWHGFEKQAEILARFESGEVPVDLLGAVLKAPPKERLATLEGLLAAGITSAAGATRAVNAGRLALDEPILGPMRPATIGAMLPATRDGMNTIVVDAPDVPDIDEDGLDSMPDTPPKKAEKAAPTAVKAPVQAIHPKTARKLAVASQHSKNPAVRAFFVGAVASLNSKEDWGALGKSLHLFSSPETRAAVAGMLWRLGCFGGAVQSHVDPEVLTLIEDGTNGGKIKNKVSKKRGVHKRAGKKHA